MTATTPEAWTEPANADLIAFLNARLDEDEAAARQAWGIEWNWRDLAQPFRERPSVAHTVHIARHDPARALREVGAKRRLIELAWDADQGDRILDEEIARDPKPGEVTTGGLILRAMAAVYSDHADYRPEWKPAEPAA